ncbi:MAG: glycolate oxidase subunit GlcE [Proteobacteria bacterium]|nr:glycolate oxidase subunit GlcE [Pseudomonadota bacterium]
MSTTLKPRDAKEVQQAVAWALAEGATLDVRGTGSKLSLGRPMRCDHVLDLSGVSGVVDYAPEELVVTLRAGTPIAEVEALLAQRNQMLAFEPPDLGPLLGRAAGEGTLVGTLQGNFAGPRRLSAGAARDHLLGFNGVNGRGEAFKSGGKVMKNVTGYDLSKLVAGSWGTLAVLDEVSVKTLPAPDQTRTLLLHGLDDAAAVTAMCAAMGSPHEVSGAAHVGTRTALRVEGVTPSVEARLKGLRALLGSTSATLEELGTLESRAFWREVRDAAPLNVAGDEIVWRLSCPPSAGAAVAARLEATLPGARWFFDWSGGLIWLAVPASPDAAHATVRAALGPTGGHATLIRAPEAVRAAGPVFHPQSPALAALAVRVKESFDPKGLFNPGRMA